MVETISRPEFVALDYLFSRQNEDGGWGYLSTHPSMVEATAVAVIALADLQSDSQALAIALEWLQRAQNADGGWGMSASDSKSGWQTAWALLALTKADIPLDVSDRGNNWLLEIEQIAIPLEGQRDMQELLNVDPTLRGWPWYPGEANWVEPTALALMALGRSGSSVESATRTRSAVQYLVDRRCGPGGWNVGNPVMLGAALPARATPTALAILALALYAPDSILADDITALHSDMHLDGGALAIALGLIALHQLGQTDEVARSTLHKLQLQDGSWNQNVFHTALALMATRDPFCRLWERCNQG